MPNFGFRCPLDGLNLDYQRPEVRPGITPSVDAGQPGGHIHITGIGSMQCNNGHRWEIPGDDLILVRTA